jgi:hypothetical protein
MGIFKSGLGLAVLTVVLAGCGGDASGRAFGWFHPQPPPAGWAGVSISNGASLAYPPNWQRQHSDTGTATAVLRAADGAYLGYVNLTPRQGDETLTGWATFRIEHNSEEGDRKVTRLATAQGLRFLTGHGACVKDAYTTKIGARYIEIACLVAGRRAETVIVAAAPPKAWSSESGTLEREIEAVRS